MMTKFAYYEYKYLVTNEQLSYVRSVLDALAGGIDPFPEGTVDSIYYDSRDHRCYHECLNGENIKRKFRIRGYGDGLFHQIHQKEKDLSGVGKYKSKIIPVSASAFNAPNWEDLRPLTPHDESFYKICSLGEQYGALVPVCRIRYYRYRYRAYDFRITLDTRIEAMAFPETRATSDHLILPFHVLELKTLMKRPKLPLMGLTALPQVSFSKFFLGLEALHGKVIHTPGM